MRIKKNSCISKVVEFSFIPTNNNIKKQFFSSSFSNKNINFKSNNTRTITEGKSYTLNK